MPVTMLQSLVVLAGMLLSYSKGDIFSASYTASLSVRDRIKPALRWSRNYENCKSNECMNQTTLEGL